MKSWLELLLQRHFRSLTSILLYFIILFEQFIFIKSFSNMIVINKGRQNNSVLCLMFKYYKFNPMINNILQCYWIVNHIQNMLINLNTYFHPYIYMFLIHWKKLCQKCCISLNTKIIIFAILEKIDKFTYAFLITINLYT